jgi:hypothetical protein
MGIPMAYNTGTTNTYTEKTVKRGTVALNPGPSLAPSYNWFNGVDITASQYLIYSDTYTTGQATQANSRPTAWTTPDLSDTSLLNLINTLPERIGQTPFTYAPVALKWLHQSNRYFLIKNNFENIVTNGLIFNLDGSWPNSYSGTTTWFDLSGQGNNGTLYNGPTFNSDSGGGISFDGADDYMAAGTLPASLQGNPKFSIGGWFKRSGTWSGGATWGIGNPGTNINSYNWSIDNSIGIDLYGNTTYNTNQTYSLTEWKHVVWTYNGSGFNRNNIVIYINGSACTGNDLTVLRDSGAAPSISDGGLTLGRVSSTENNYYGKPIIGNFQVYNRVLSPSEIMQNFYAQGYRFGYSADTIVTSGLTVYLDASNSVSNPGSGTTWYDMSVTKSNDFSLVNGVSFTSFSGGTIYLDGTNDYSVSAKNSGILGNSPRTYIGWYYIISTSLGGWGNLLTTGNNDCSSKMFGWSRQGTTLMTWGGCYDLDSGLSLPLNTWLFIAASYDGVNYDAYVNTNTVRLNRSGYDTTESKIFLGAETVNDGASFRGYMNGHIGSMYQYNRALSSSEITQMYNATKGRFGL